ncbi:unnamed protein product [Rhizophagus irregularis]|nr:unnamed protein product [Rhizophagus irregularis]
MRKEDNTAMNLKIISFFPKNPSVPKWIPDFTSDDVVRFTGKFSLNLMMIFWRQVQDDDDLFKSIKLNVNEFVGEGNVADKFNIKSLTSDNSSEAEADKNQDEYFEIKSESTD